ncbi:hypothetical protein PPSIR1_24239 [Plesiocystis pacifica SIR-1]|uniref:Uncharacterized protein n=1 Tax=Plesiocystis pacifica SIR-1 TaxID=391625 RepID=A6GC12_9BACT|nr:hypothetical protein [Plesiocystis pacifica]EDM76574.1 hypothetical protein PPSIR1_24239 [Plesiocystis pacifica SIR-1]
MSTRTIHSLLVAAAALTGACAASSPDSEGGGEASAQTEAETHAAETSACSRYGGPGEVGGVVSEHIVPALTGDCRVSAMFTSLPEPAQVHLVECLTIQVQELFACEGASYAGAEDSTGALCRDMVSAHAGLGITNGDFDAVIEDIVAGLQAAGISQADIDAVAPAVLSTRADMVEVQTDALSNSSCG